MSIILLYCWLMVALRGLGIVLLFPTLGVQQLPAIMRVALTMMLATILYGIVPHAAQMPPTVYGMVVAAGGEVVLGLAMGFVGRLIFNTIEMAGRIMSQNIGLGGIPGIDTPRPSEEPLAALLSMFAGLIFFLSGAHLTCLAAFARSFDLAPAGMPMFSPGSSEQIVNATGHVIELGFRIAAPFIAMDFLINMAFSVLGRAVPKMNVFVLSYTVRTMVGLGLLATAGMLIARYLLQEFNVVPIRMLELLPLKT